MADLDKHTTLQHDVFDLSHQIQHILAVNKSSIVWPKEEDLDEHAITLSDSDYEEEPELVVDGDIEAAGHGDMAIQCVYC